MGMIVTIALLGLVFMLFLAPALHLKLGKGATTTAMLAGLLLSASFMLHNATSYVSGPTVATMGIMSGVLAGIGMFCLVFASVRFTNSPGPLKHGVAKGKVNNKKK